MGPISTLLQHTPNEYASIRTSAGYLSKEIGSGVAGGVGVGVCMWVHKHPVHALVQPCIIVVFIVIIDTWLLTHSQYM